MKCKVSVQRAIGLAVPHPTELEEVCNIRQKLYFIPILDTLLINNCNADATLAANEAENERVVAEASGSGGSSARSTATSRLEASLMFAEAMGESSPGDQPRRSTGGLLRRQTRRQAVTSGTQAESSGSQAVPSDRQAGASGRSSSGIGKFLGMHFRRSNR